MLWKKLTKIVKVYPAKLYITPAVVANGFIDWSMNKWMLRFIINMSLLILGCFRPPAAIILNTAPILHPTIKGLGFDPIWFGVIMTLNMEGGDHSTHGPEPLRRPGNCPRPTSL